MTPRRIILILVLLALLAVYFYTFFQHKEDDAESDLTVSSYLPDAATLYIRFTLGDDVQEPINIRLEYESDMQERHTILVETLSSGEVSYDFEIPLGKYKDEIATIYLSPADPSLGTWDIVRFYKESPAMSPEPSILRPNILVYVVDTLRKDALGAYSSLDEVKTPAFDALAQSSQTYESAYAPSSWTRSTVASLFTGAHAPLHGVTTRETGLRPDVPMLAEYFSAKGYRTTAIITNGNISREYGLARGFDDYVYLKENPDSPEFHRSAQDAHAKALEILDRATRDPFFLYVHVSDPHAPYTPPEAAGLESPPIRGDLSTMRELIYRTQPVNPKMVAYLHGLYTGEVRDLDRAFGAFYQELTQRNILKNTIFIVTSDHGEEFQEHQGFGHGQTLYEELVAVPLIIHIPGVAPARVRRLTSLTDIAPSLKSLMETINFGGGFCDPENLFREKSFRRAIYSHTAIDKVRKDAVIMGPWKYIRNNNRVNQWGETVIPSELYRLDRDPREQNEMGDEFPIARKYLDDVITQCVANMTERARGFAEPVTVTPSEELHERLQAVGYMQ